MKKRKVILSIVIIIILLSILGGGYCIKLFLIDTGKVNLGKINVLIDNSAKNKNLIDDWAFNGETSNSNSLKSSVTNGLNYNSSNMYMTTDSISESFTESTLGLSTGGAKNINNFRENIKNGYFPISTDITYNGLYYDYYFNTRKTVAIKNSAKSTQLFSPSYSTAISKDPISGQVEYYMTVGLNSNIKQSDFQRKKLNLVVVLDISGSMSSAFNSYYYDGLNEDLSDEEKNSEDKNKTKMQIANESVNLLIDELNEDDRLGIVLFDDSSYLAKPLNLVGNTDLQKIKDHVLEIQPQGGTNFSAGFATGTELFTEEMLNNSEYENRIIVITDAMPNMGETSKNSLAKSVETNAENGIFTSFIGVGVDFNTQVVECLSNVKGANYYSVHSSQEFKKIMGEDFEYMVTPLVFDLELNFDSDVFSIEKVYGSDAADCVNGNIMKVNTLFPSSSNSSGEAKGGIVLLKLKYDLGNRNVLLEDGADVEKKVDAVVSLSVSYKDRDGKVHSNSQEVVFGKEIVSGNLNGSAKTKEAEEYYENTGIRKGIVLARYVNLMKNWILYERSENAREFLIMEETGIVDGICEVSEVKRVLGENERMSVKLSVSDEYKELFEEFYTYMEAEMKAIGDEEMKQELEVLKLLK